ncbi:MAG TPA: hypothetical protein VJN43_13660 [Bryobacteraceae bacterium]|nr:hypothetical protein [Bryobacteraceae bacterium]
MSKRAGLALILVAAALFLVLNRTAYKGYFQDDDLDTLSWTQFVPAGTYFSYLVTPRFSAINFRPMGHLYYFIMESVFGLDFPKYLIPLHVLHLVNIWLFWLLARKLGLGPLAASAGAFLFGFHAVLTDAWWKPMYVFDILTTAFCLASLLLYMGNRWVLSLIAFWLAYKSKEVAVALPVVLACYELFLGEKRWKRLIPFFATAVLFGVQALTQQPQEGADYQLHLAPAAQAATIGFYSSQLFFLPYAALALVILPFLIRDRRLWFGFAAACLFLAPLLLLPGRLYAVYWYLPLTGVALMFATLADGPYRLAVPIFLALWIPWDFTHFRETRRIDEDRERLNRAYVGEVVKFTNAQPGQTLWVYDNLPDGFHRWGVNGALVFACQRRDIRMMHLNAPGAEEFIQSGDAVWLHWAEREHELYIIRYPRVRGAASYLTMELGAPASQLVSGWYGLEPGVFRWTKPKARATLERPAGAYEFELVANIMPAQVANHHTVDFRVLANGQVLGRHAFIQPGWQTVRWPIPDAPAGQVEIEFHTSPPYRSSKGDPRIFGVAVKSFGFVPR